MIDKSFYKVYTGSADYVTMDNSVAGFSSWTFSGECYARKDNYVQVGNKEGGKGYITTPEFGVSGSVKLFLTTASINKEAATVKIDISNGGSIETNTFNIAASSAHTAFSILIAGATPSTTITISNQNGRFYIKDIIAYVNGDELFYESFSMMNGNPESEFDYDANKATSSLCDNSGSSFGSNVSQFQNYKSIYLADNKYIMPAISSIITGNRYLLSFKISEMKTSSYPEIEVSCNDDATLTEFNTMSIGSLSNPRTEILRDEKYDTWQDYYVVVSGMTNTTRISIHGEYLFLDEVMLTEIPSNLDQTKDNSLFIDAYAGETRDVTLSRTLTPNIWCPLCLPFDVTPAKMAADMDVACEVRTLTSISDGVFTFDAVESSTTVTAGTPFLVKVPSAVVNPTLTSVVVSTTTAQTASASTSDYKFIGTYSPVELNTNGTHLFLGTDGKLYKPSTGAGENLLGGLRAYFEVPAAAQSARIMINDEVSAVEDVRTATSQQLFDLYGRQISNHSPKRGLYIVRPAEGRLQGKNGKKIIVK